MKLGLPVWFYENFPYCSVTNTPGAQQSSSSPTANSSPILFSTHPKFNIPAPQPFDDYRAVPHSDISQHCQYSWIHPISPMGWPGLKLTGDAGSVPGVSCAPQLRENVSVQGGKGSSEYLLLVTASHSSGLYFLYYFMAKVAVEAFAAFC